MELHQAPTRISFFPENTNTSLCFDCDYLHPKAQKLIMLKVYGIPTCNTCKKVLKWLEAQGIPHTFIDIKLTPPPQATIAQWVKTLGAKPMRNTSGKAYRTIGPEKQNWTDDQWITAFSKDAMLLKRPLFERDGTAIKVGFRGTDEELIVTFS